MGFFVYVGMGEESNRTQVEEIPILNTEEVKGLLQIKEKRDEYLLGSYKLTNGMFQRLTGLLASSILSENEKEEWLAKLPELYVQESWDLHEYLLNNQTCPITQMAQFSNKAVDKRLDYVMADETL